MQSKSFKKVFFYGIGILVCLMITFVLVYYFYSTESIKAFLSDAVQIGASAIVEKDDNSFIENNSSAIRFTLIDKNGAVIADSDKSAEIMNDHSDRREVIDALEKGEGFSVRHSETLNKNTYYYAVKLENGNVLRASITADTLLSYSKNAAIILLVSIFIIAVLSFFISRAITKSIFSPIAQIGENIENAGSAEDYEEIQPLVNAVNEQKEKEKQLEKQKRQFTANVSHELKTPLTSIAGYAELIENGMAKQEDIKPFAHTIRTQALQLITLTEDIIQLSQLDEAENDIAFEKVSIKEIVEKCSESLKINASLKGIELKKECSDCLIIGNKALLEEMIYNLIDNAIRYNKENGSVKIKTYETEQYSVFSVSDTGIGIPEKYKERIFERFFRVDKSRSKQTGGTGLGLAIVKHIAEVHNADITVKSELDKGTEIKVRFDKAE